MARLMPGFVDRDPQRGKFRRSSVLQRTKFELVINLKIPKEFGLAISDTLFTFSGEVIE
jgi:hypothetical protein